VPGLLPIRAGQDKTYRQIHDEIRAVQRRPGDPLFGASATNRFTRFVPDLLLRAAARGATRSLTIAKRYGVVTLTSPGMYGRGPGWGIPLSAWTVAVTVGGIAPRPVLRDGQLQAREFLCLTASFDHDLVDGGPAVRFMRRFAELLRDAEGVLGRPLYPLYRGGMRSRGRRAGPPSPVSANRAPAATGPAQPVMAAPSP